MCFSYNESTVSNGTRQLQKVSYNRFYKTFHYETFNNGLKTWHNEFLTNGSHKINTYQHIKCDSYILYQFHDLSFQKDDCPLSFQLPLFGLKISTHGSNKWLIQDIFQSKGQRFC